MMDPPCKWEKRGVLTLATASSTGSRICMPDNLLIDERDRFHCRATTTAATRHAVRRDHRVLKGVDVRSRAVFLLPNLDVPEGRPIDDRLPKYWKEDRKSTRLNSSH